jgi:hypothetical protein
MNRRKALLTLSALLGVMIIVFPVTGPASPGELIKVYPSEKAEKISELLQLTGSGDLGKQFVVAIFERVKTKVPQVPEEFWLRMEAKIDPREMEMLVVPIYDKYFTLEDIRGLHAFYSSPLGKKLISVQPQIMQESMLAGQEWSAKITADVMREIGEQMERPTADSLPKPSEQR